MGGAMLHNNPDRLSAKGGKGRREYTREKRPPKERRSLIVDPYEMQLMEEYIDSLQSHNPYGAFALKQMAVQPWASAVISTRQNQVSEFATPRQSQFEMGFVIATRDPKKHPQPYERREMDRIRDLMMTCGSPIDSLYSTTADSFETFLRKITWDSLTYDASVFEIIPDKRGIPARWVAVDASTIYKVAPKNEYGDYAEDDAAYVQVIDGTRKNWFSADEMCFGIRRPRTDVKSGLYGYPELVELINVLTAMMFGWSYNMNFFRQGGPKGVLAVLGDMPEKNFRVFQRQLMFQAVSVKNAHRTVVVNPAGQGADLKWIPFTGASPSDIQFAEWVNANFRLLCFVDGTPVMLANGQHKAIEDICPGDKVLAVDGKADSVANIQRKEIDEDIYAIRVGGRLIKATSEHPFLVVPSSAVNHTPRIFGKPEWRSSRDLAVGDFLVVPKPASDEGTCSRIDVSKYGDFNIEQDSIKPNGNHAKTVARYIDLDEESAFVLGLFMAEGSTTDYRITYSFNINETELINRAIRFAERIGCKSNVVRYEKTNGAVVQINSAVYGRAFRKMFGGGSVDIKIPDELWDAPRNIQKAFLSGAIAGDGSVWVTGNNVVSLSYSSVSERAVTEFQSMMLRQGVYGGVYETKRQDKKHKSLQSYRVNGTSLYSIAKWLLGEKGDLLRCQLANRDKKVANGDCSPMRSKSYSLDGYYCVPITDISTERFVGDVFNLETSRTHTYVASQVCVHNCSLFQIEPSEVGFYYQPEGGRSSPMFETSPEAKLKAGKDKGLRPLLRSISYWLNRYIIWRINPDFEIRFLGLSTLSEMEQAQLDQMRLQTYLKPNELRAEKDLSDLGPAGDIPCNPIIVQLHQLAEAQKQIQAQQPPPGEEEKANVDMAGEGAEKPSGERGESGPVIGEGESAEGNLEEAVSEEKSLSHEDESEIPAMNALVKETSEKPTEKISEVFRRIEAKLKEQAS